MYLYFIYESIMAERRQRRPVKCGLCKQEGHNIRSCNLFPTVRREGIRQYESWIHHSIVCHSTQNTNPTYTLPLLPMNDELLTMIQNNTPLETIINTPISWIRRLDNTSLNALLYGYSIDTNASREDVLFLLHYIFMAEADTKWTQNIDVQKSIPYLMHSQTHIALLENTYMKVFNYAILGDVQNIRTGLHSAESREDRIRVLYSGTMRMLRHSSQELIRNERRAYDVRRQLSRVENELRDLEEVEDSIRSRRRQYEQELAFFPEGCIKPQIQMVDKTHEDTIECPVCFENINPLSVVSLSCDHQYCIPCAMNTIIAKYDRVRHRLQCTCPLCRIEITKLHGLIPRMKARMEEVKKSHNIEQELTSLIG